MSRGIIDRVVAVTVMALTMGDVASKPAPPRPAVVHGPADAPGSLSLGVVE